MDLARYTTLDISQLEAVHHVFTSRLEIIQGPPGTGKTYLGHCITELLLSMDVKPILVLSYKNHALDEFLSMSLQRHPNDIARIGRRTDQNAKLNKVNLNELLFQAGKGNVELKQSAAKRMTQEKHAEDQIKKHEQLVKIHELTSLQGQMLIGQVRTGHQVDMV